MNYGALALFLATILPGGCTIYDDTCGGQQGFRCSMIPEDTDTALDESGSSDDGGACLAENPGATVLLENRTGNAIEVVYFLRCDGTDASEFPLMPPGLASDSDVELPLPGPGCWLFDYSGEGCEGAMPHQTPMEVCAGETYVWTADESNHVCAG